jgi:hypothetical protein
MAKNDALFNEVARLANIEFFEHGQPLTGDLLRQLITAVGESLTDEPVSA